MAELLEPSGVCVCVCLSVCLSVSLSWGVCVSVCLSVLGEDAHILRRMLKPKMVKESQT